MNIYKKNNHKGHDYATALGSTATNALTAHPSSRLPGSYLSRAT